MKQKRIQHTIALYLNTNTGIKIEFDFEPNTWYNINNLLIHFVRTLCFLLNVWGKYGIPTWYVLGIN